MRITLDIDTEQLTDADRRVLAALINGDAAPLVLPREMYRDLSQPGAPLVPAGHTPAAPPAAPPSPTPAPPEFLAKLGEAVGQFAGTQHEARLPYSQQAGVRTRSTMPADDDAADTVPVEIPRELADELENNQATVIGIVQQYRAGTTVPRDLVEEGDAGDFESAVMHAVSTAQLDDQAADRGDAEPRVPDLTTPTRPRLVQSPPPVRHTTP